jgi:putative flippase GtrA
VTKLSPWGLRDRVFRTPTGQKLVKYTMVSLISVVIGQALLLFAFNIFKWDGVPSNVFAVGISAIPSYYLNRAWAWGKRGRSHFLKEVVPFWAMAFLGLALSTVFVAVADSRSGHLNRVVQARVVSGASIGAFGVLWVAKFVILNKVLFAHHEEDLEDMPALDGRTGIPT